MTAYLKNISKSVLAAVSCVLLVSLLYHASDGDMTSYGTDELMRYTARLAVPALSLSLLSMKNVRWVGVDLVLLLMAGIYSLSVYAGERSAASKVALEEVFPYVLLWLSVKALSSIRGRRWNTFLMLVFCVWLLAESVNGLSQVFGHRPSGHVGFGMTGSFSNPGPYGGLIAVLMSVSASYVLRHRRLMGLISKLFLKGIAGIRSGQIWGSVYLRWILLRFFPFMTASASVVLGFMVLPATRSRAGWLALCVALLLYACRETHFWSKLRYRRAAVAVLAVAIPTAAVGVFMLKKDSALGRLHIWNVEIRAVASSPLIGYGPGTALGAYGDTQEAYFRSAERGEWEKRVAGCPEYAFNEYLKAGIETGLPGLVLAVCIAAFSVLELMKSGSVFAYGAAASSVFAFFSYPLSVMPLAVLYTILLGVSCGVSRPGGRCAGVESQVKPVPVWMRASTVLMAVTLGIVAFHLRDTYLDRRTAMDVWTSSRYLSGLELYEDSLEELEGLYPELFWNYRYLYDYGYALHKTGDYARSNDILQEGAAISSDPMFHNVIGKNYEALGDNDTAEGEYVKAHNMVPCRLYPLVLLMEMYSKTGNETEALDVAERILEMPVNCRNRTMMGLREKAEEELSEKDMK